MSESMTTSNPARDDVPLYMRWDAEAIFANADAWEAEYEAIRELIPGVEGFKGHLGESPDILLSAIKALEEIQNRLEILYVYAGFSQAVDTANQESAAMVGKAGSLAGQIAGATAYAAPEMLAIGRDTISAWLVGKLELMDYAHYFDDLFRRAEHIRSPEVEEVLGLISDVTDTFRQTYGFLSNSEMDFAPATSSDGEPLEVTQASVETILREPDREARRTAYHSFNDQHLAHRNTLAVNLSGAIKANAFRAKVRNHGDSLSASLFNSNIPTEVFHNLLDVFVQNLPTWHRYWDIKRRALGYDEIRPYDIWAPLDQNPPKVTYRQSVTWLCEALEPLGSDYVETMRLGATEDRWVDYAPNRGKRQGAFSWGTQGMKPFICMSYNDQVKDMSTLAHELGHSMHSYLTWENQPFVYAEYTLFAAEVASNFHQAMLRDYLLKKTADDPAMQLALIEEAMGNLHRYFFIMPNLARWELEMHRRAEEGEPLTATIMSELAADFFAEGYGDSMTFDREQRGIIWSQFGHMFANFYVYTYATGISGAHAFADRVLGGAENAVEDYLGFLKSGGAKYPLDALMDAGVDLTTPATVESAFNVLAGYVDRLEELVG